MRCFGGCGMALRVTRPDKESDYWGWGWVCCCLRCSLVPPVRQSSASTSSTAGKVSICAGLQPLVYPLGVVFNRLNNYLVAEHLKRSHKSGVEDWALTSEQVIEGLRG